MWCRHFMGRPGMWCNVRRSHFMWGTGMRRRVRRGCFVDGAWMKSAVGSAFMPAEQCRAVSTEDAAGAVLQGRRERSHGGALLRIARAEQVIAEFVSQCGASDDGRHFSYPARRIDETVLRMNV